MLIATRIEALSECTHIPIEVCQVLSDFSDYAG